MAQFEFDKKESQPALSEPTESDQTVADGNQDLKSVEQVKNLFKKFFSKCETAVDVYDQFIKLMESLEHYAEQTCMSMARTLSLLGFLVLVKEMGNARNFYNQNFKSRSAVGMDEKFMADREEMYRELENCLLEREKGVEHCKDLSAKLRFLRDEFKSKCSKVNKLIKNFEKCSDVTTLISNLNKELSEVDQSMTKIDEEKNRLLNFYKVESEMVTRDSKKFTFFCGSIFHV
ncbi:hypothetical protein QAD02_010790 [Eretmocerus hayati]|uniref:Uncharacterized protein n=1 Tax=Eretmocerus hayati TaxID=131215 RepID=A0ACC2NXI1_9HYME|nr:hypothetical protein QAD02_010790 [Eretmocerus hayati]